MSEKKYRIRLSLWWRVKKPPEKSPKWGWLHLGGKKPNAKSIVRHVFMDAGYTAKDIRELFTSASALKKIHGLVLSRMEAERKKAGAATAYLVRTQIGVVTGNPKQANPKQVVLAYDDYWHRKPWADKSKQGGWMISKSPGLGAPAWKAFAGPKTPVVKVKAHTRKWPSGNPRRNKGKISDKPESWRSAKNVRDYADIYKRWHWGIPHDDVVNWNDADTPDKMIEIGRLWELHYRPWTGRPNPKGQKARGKKKVIEVAKRHKNKCYLVFDPHHRHQRMYALTDAAVQADTRRAFWDNNDYPEMPLARLARLAGGRHAASDYPRVNVKPVGTFTDVVYRTHKRGDDDDVRGSSYIHALGEESRVYPVLAVDRRGRFWIAGGNYTCPTPGITD